MEGQDRSVRLIGRAAEMELLQAELRRSAGGEFRVVVVEGAAGVGKSRLISEFAAHRQVESRVLTARSFRLGATSSFGPWMEALERLRPLEENEKFPVLPRTDQMDRARLLDELTNALRRLSDDRPLLVVLDDMHLADDSSWEALRYMARRLWDRPVAVTAAARPVGQMANPLAPEVLFALEDEGQLRRLHLRPLNGAEMADLTRAVLASLDPAPPMVPQRLVDWLMERSLGHPLFAIGLLRARAREERSLGHPDLTSLPVSLRQRVGLDFHALSPSEREVLELLAVFDRRVDVAELADARSDDIEKLVEVLDALAEAGLVTSDAARYEIVHPLIQEAVYELTGTGRRLVLHRSVAQSLLGRGRWGEAAGHFARSAPIADDASVEALCSAIRLAEDRGLYREELAILAALLDVLPEGDARWSRVLQSLDWDSEWVIGHLAEGDADSAAEAMRRIKRVFRVGDDPAVEGTVDLHLASFLSIGTGDLPAAKQACSQAIELFRAAGRPDRRLLAENEMVWIVACEGDLAGAAVLADRILATVDEGTDPSIAIQAGGSGGYALSLMGRWHEATQRFEYAGRLAAATDNVYRRLWGVAQRSVAWAFDGRLEEAATALEEALASHYDLACDALALERLAFLRLLQGELPECTRLIDESGSRRATRGSRRRAWGLAVAARAYVETGKRERAARNLTQARDAYRTGEMLEWSGWCPWTGGVLALQEDDTGGAVAQYERAAQRYRSMDAAPFEALVLADLIDATLTGGDLPAAREAAGRLSRITSEAAGPLMGGLGHLSRAVLDLSEGGAASPAAAIAAEVLQEAGYELHTAIALHLDGVLRRRVGDDSAVERLEDAARKAEKCGAMWRRDRTLALLVREGSRGRRVAGAVLGLEALTAREREVAALAAQGHTAREIADRLFIGVRTVETHLANAYPKLGVASKKDLVKRGEELGLR